MNNNNNINTSSARDLTLVKHATGEASKSVERVLPFNHFTIEVADKEKGKSIFHYLSDYAADAPGAFVDILSNILDRDSDVCRNGVLKRSNGRLIQLNTICKAFRSAIYNKLASTDSKICVRLDVLHFFGIGHSLGLYENEKHSTGYSINNENLIPSFTLCYRTFSHATFLSNNELYIGPEELDDYKKYLDCISDINLFLNLIELDLGHIQCDWEIEKIPQNLRRLKLMIIQEANVNLKVLPDNLEHLEINSCDIDKEDNSVLILPDQLPLKLRYLKLNNEKLNVAIKEFPVSLETLEIDNIKHKNGFIAKPPSALKKFILWSLNRDSLEYIKQLPDTLESFTYSYRYTDGKPPFVMPRLPRDLKTLYAASVFGGEYSIEMPLLSSKLEVFIIEIYDKRKVKCFTFPMPNDARCVSMIEARDHYLKSKEAAFAQNKPELLDESYFYSEDFKNFGLISIFEDAIEEETERELLLKKRKVEENPKDPMQGRNFCVMLKDGDSGNCTKISYAEFLWNYVKFK